MPDIKLKKFDPKKITANRVCTFIGRRGSGKTTCEKDIMWHLRWIPDGVVYSPTEESNGDWEHHFPSSFIYSEYDPDSAKRIVARQRRRAKKHKYDRNYQITPTVIVCEDCMFDKKRFVNDKTARGVLMNGRQWWILLLISVQYMMDLTRDMRTQFDYIFLFKDNDIGNRERLWKSWGGVVPTFDAFSEIFSQCTKEYGCLVIDNTSLSEKIEDSIFWYKAQERDPNYKVGNRAFWLYHFANIRDEEDMEDEFEPLEKKQIKSKYRVQRLR